MKKKSQAGKKIRQMVASLFDLYYPAEVQGPSGHELDENYLFDFRNYAAGGGNMVGGVYTATVAFGPNGVTPTGPTKLKVSPRDVLNELETIPSPISMQGLDDKIAMLEKKRTLITQQYSKRDVDGLIERLKNRKKYPGPAKEFFDSFPNTTDEKIEVLTGKYDLVLRDANLFIPEFPDVAVKIMKEYEAHCVEVSGKKPVFYVIATEDSFKKAYQKRDPILLAQSPFGFYWQILGAWDREMMLLSEL